MPDTTTTPPAQLGLGPAWTPVLARLVDDQDLQRWRRTYVLSTEPVTTAQLRAVALAMSGERLTDITRRGGSKGLHKQELENLALAVALRYVGNDAAWRLPRPPTTGHRLLRNGLPPSSRGPRQLYDPGAFLALWTAGAPLTQIAHELGLSLATTARLAAAAQPARWRAADVSAYLGWTGDNLYQRANRGHFPAPDGHDPQLRWWWPATITSWADAQNLHTCPDCGARVQRMPQHQTRHTRVARAALVDQDQA
jgi:hypothetical protein